MDVRLIGQILRSQGFCKNCYCSASPLCTSWFSRWVWGSDSLKQPIGAVRTCNHKLAALHCHPPFLCSHRLPSRCWLPHAFSSFCCRSPLLVLYVHVGVVRAPHVFAFAVVLVVGGHVDVVPSPLRLVFFLVWSGGEGYSSVGSLSTISSCCGSCSECGSGWCNVRCCVSGCVAGCRCEGGVGGAQGMVSGVSGSSPSVGSDLDVGPFSSCCVSRSTMDSPHCSASHSSSALAAQLSLSLSLALPVFLLFSF